MDHPRDDRPRSFWSSPAGLTLIVAAAVAGFYLVTEHQAHLYGLLPYLLLLACPLMHLLMHRGHGHGHGPGRDHAASGGSRDEQRFQ